MSATPLNGESSRVMAEGAVGHRMDELEREYRRLRRYGTILLIGMGLTLGLLVAIVVTSAKYGMPGTVADVVAARQFVLRDGRGAVRGIWGTETNGTLRLVFQDGSGRPRTRLNLLPDGSSGLTFSDTAGHARAVFALLPDQTASVVFADAAGKSRSVFGISPSGEGTLVFADRAGATRASLGVDAGGAGSFVLLDRNGRDQVEPAAEPPAPEVEDTASAPTPNAAPPRRR